MLVIDRLLLRTNQGGIEPENKPKSRPAVDGSHAVAWRPQGSTRGTGGNCPHSHQGPQTRLCPGFAWFDQFTTLIGRPARKADTLATVASMRRPRASAVAQAMCGVIRQFFAPRSGLSGSIGSRATTSTAAPASLPEFSASARSS